MLKQTITYTDFDGVERSEDFYFNLTKTELTEMEVSVDGGMANFLRKIVASENNKELFAMFKKILMVSVGVKSDDGKRFVKSAEITNDFLASPAFDELFMDMASDAAKAAEFIKGVMPREIAEGIDTKEIDKLPTGVPTPTSLGH